MTEIVALISARSFLLNLLVAATALCSTALRGDPLTFKPGTVATSSSAPQDTTTANWLNGGSVSVWTSTTANDAAFAGPSVAVTLASGGIALTGGYYEIVPVPEPATWLGGLGVLGAGILILHSRSRHVANTSAA